jgi:hypothetical protein
MQEKFDPKTRRPLHLICRAAFLAAGDMQIEAADYSGFSIKTVEGDSRTFLLLRWRRRSRCC